MSSWIFKEAGEKSPPDPKAARRRAMLLSAPFVLMGLFAVVLLMHDGLLGGLSRQMAIKLLSVIIVSAGFPALIFGITAKKKSLADAKLKSPGPETSDKPWSKREDWAAGRIVSSSRGAAVFLWIFAIFWTGISAAITLVVVPQQWRSGNHTVIIALLLPVVGIAILVFAFNSTMAWRRYGRSVFEMAAVPGAPGGTLEGMIQVKTRLQPEHGLHLRLSCIRQMTTGSGKDRHTAEKILWQDEKWLRADLPQTDLNATGIPVYFRLPGDQPESTPGGGNGIHWKLEASARVPGPNFQATFDVPVFQLPETPAPSDDPTVQYQMSLDEVRQQIHSRIRVNDLPDGGREFIFPAARNPGFASGATAFWLIWTGVIAVMIWKHAPPLFPLVFGALDLLMGVFSFDLWFRRSRVAVTPSQVQIETSWLGIRNRRRLEASDVAAFATEVGATAGHSAYFDLKVVTRDQREFTAAKNLNSKPEADWLVREMKRVLDVCRL